MITVELKGVDNVIRKAEGEITQLLVTAGPAVFEEALLTESKAKGRTPVDKGPLRASYVTSRPKYTGRDISVTISVGGPAAPYAEVQHEDLTLHHPRGGQAKFLESAVREDAPGFPQRVGRRMQR